MDDYSRIVRVYLSKEMTQVPNVIKDFINEIKTYFSTTIHILRTDNT